MPSHSMSVHGNHSAPTPTAPAPVSAPSAPPSAPAHGAGHGTPAPTTTRAPGLEPSAPAHQGVKARLTMSPARALPGEPFRLLLRLADAQGRSVDPQIVHERPVHLLVISDDLADFQHVHPKREREGSYALELTVPRARSYRLFAEYTGPGAEAPSLASATVGSAARAAPAATITGDLAEKLIGNSRVAIRGADGLRSGVESMFEVVVRDAKTGERPGDLQPWLGAPAHGVIVDARLRGLVHAHAVEGGGAAENRPRAAMQHALTEGGEAPTFTFHAKFDRPGLHKVWVQFDRGGEVITAPFVVDVA